MHLKLTKDQPGWTTWINLVGISVHGAPPFDPPDRFVDPATGPPVTLHIKGCRIGHDAAFMHVLKGLLSNMTIRAPKHLDEFFKIPGKGALYRLEHLSYYLQVDSPEAITDWDQLMTAFAAHFDDFPQYAVTNDISKKFLWDSDLRPYLIQLKKLSKALYLPTSSSRAELRQPLRATITFPDKIAGQTTLSARFAQYRAQRMRYFLPPMSVSAFNSKTINDHITDFEADWNQTFRGAIGDNNSSQTRDLNIDMELLARESIPSVVKWVSFDTKMPDPANPKKSVPAKGIAGIYFRYALLIPISSVTDGTLFYDAKREKGPALTKPSNWPSDPTEMGNLFATIT
jgi:hypothetical protein